MINRWKYLIAASSILMLAGAGCNARQQTEVKPSPNVDANVNAIINDETVLDQEQAAEENDALDLEADKTEINAYGETNYESN